MQGGQKLDAAVFHAANVYLHAMVTALLVLVLRLYALVPSVGGQESELSAMAMTGILV